jgi:hypothetical protein
MYLEEVGRMFLRKLGIYLPDSTASHISRENTLNVNVVLFIQCVFLRSVYPHRNLTTSWALNNDIVKSLAAFERKVLRMFGGINVNENW